jgi:phytoene synthase
MLSPTAALVQRHDSERFVTALFAPAQARETLFTLYAFNHELARAREVASIPPLALIRLQWWREVVQGAARAHEVATPLRAAIDAGVLDPRALEAMVDARTLEAEDSVDEPQWTGYLRGAGGMLMRQAACVLGAEAEAEALERLGAGCAAVGLLRNQQAHQAAGRWSFPADRSADWCKQAAVELLGPPRQWPKRAVPAALPAIFARRYLHRSGLQGPDPFARLAVWAAAARGLV